MYLEYEELSLCDFGRAKRTGECGVSGVPPFSIRFSVDGECLILTSTQRRRKVLVIERKHNIVRTTFIAPSNRAECPGHPQRPIVDVRGDGWEPLNSEFDVRRMPPQVESQSLAMTPSFAIEDSNITDLYHRIACRLPSD